MVNPYDTGSDPVERRFLMWGIFMAFIITLAINLPAAVEWYRTGKTDAALIMSLQGEDEARYVSRIHEFGDGEIMMGNPFIKEHKSDLPPSGFAEVAIALPMSIFGLSLGQALALSDILFPFLILLLTYLWVYAGVRSKLLASVFLLLFYLNIQYGIVREHHPKITLIPFSLYLYMLFGYQRSRGVLVIRGLLIGIMFYTYPYHWIYLIVFEVLDGLVALFKHKSYRVSMRETLYVFLPFLIFALPWIILIRSTVDPTIVKQVYEHFSMIATRTPVAPWLQAIIVCWIAATGGLMLTKLRTDKPIRTIFLLLCAALITLNSNLITGYDIEFLGHYTRIFTPLILFTIVLTAQVLCNKKWLKRLAWFIVVFSVIAIGHLTLGITRDVRTAENAIEPQWKVIDYIRQELPENSVILAPTELNQILPALTSAYPFMSNATHFFFVSEAEVTDRYLAFIALFPENLYSGDSKYLPVFGNNPSAAWAKARTWHRILSMLGFAHGPFTKTQGDFALDQTLRKRIDKEISNTDWRKTRETLGSYELDYIFSKKPLPSELQDLFSKQTTIESWTVYKRIKLQNVF